MFRILESQAPAKQNAETTISTLSGRLQSATLLEDRRAAILGLRSFAKAYPASVASGALKSLISCLSKDVEDVDTSKIILETLLMLFNPDDASPEASDDIALWLADEFTQRQENITVLLDLLDQHEFFPRLYSLQLISAVSSARPERAQECVYTAPLGVSRLVAVLEDKREAVRSEGLTLLTALTVSSPELQKLVAFESAFERIFGIIDAEGSLTHGGMTVQECLSLLANLLRLNASNQSYFRETGWVKKLAALFRQAIQEETSKDSVADWARPLRDKNLWGLLAVVRLFLLRGSIGTQTNQRSLWQSGVLAQVLEIAFHQSFDLTIRAEALITSADLIKDNGSLQEAFAQFEVLSTQAAEVSSQVNGHVREQIPPARDNVISGLLDLALASSSMQSFDVRLASCECLKAYFFGHAPIRLYFLQRAIEGHTLREPDNILSIITEASENGHGSDPYRSWIASVLLFHLLFEDFEAKNLARTVTEGDANAGEEVITCVQAIAGNFISAKQKGEDERILLGYLMVLCGWLYEDHDAVNDFLGEGSNVQSIVQILKHSQQSQPLTSGVCAFLLGIIYEFSTKDSPISRDTLHQILTTQLSREQYVDKITKLREHPVVRDFEVLPQNLHSSHFGGLPEVFFDKTFVDFLKDNFSRIIRAIDRAPNIEVPVIANGVQKGISRELVDSLKAQVEDANQRIQKLEAEIVTHERKLGQEQADHRKAKETSAIELNRIKSINEALQRNHEDNLQQISRDHQVVQMNHQRASEEAIRSLQNDMRRLREEHDVAANRVRLRNDEEAEDLKSTIRSLEGKLEKSSKDHVQDLQTQDEEHIAKLSSLEARLRRTEDKGSDAEARSASLQKEVDEKEAARNAAQTELDDLFLVLGELEEKRARDKQRLRAHGDVVSDDEGERGNEDGEKSEEEDDEHGDDGDGEST